MCNIDVIKCFLAREEAKTPERQINDNYYSWRGRTLESKPVDAETMILINYKTIIAKINTTTHTLYVNHNKYSRTTSKIQGQLMNLAKNTNYNIDVLEGGEE